MCSLLLEKTLNLSRCPHCSVDKPSLEVGAAHATTDSEGCRERVWFFYQCKRCGGVVTASARGEGFGNNAVLDLFPKPQGAPDELPEKPKEFLNQAIQTIHAPAGPIMLSASAVDAMLKAQGYTEGRLFPRINQAVSDHKITEAMGEWAHAIRLDANDQRHADENAPLPNTRDAQRCIDFAMALAPFLFVLPAMVARGLNQPTEDQDSTTGPNDS